MHVRILKRALVKHCQVMVHNRSLDHVAPKLQEQNPALVPRAHCRHWMVFRILLSELLQKTLCRNIGVPTSNCWRLETGHLRSLSLLEKRRPGPLNKSVVINLIQQERCDFGLQSWACIRHQRMGVLILW